jgi:hypothetical protein
MNGFQLKYLEWSELPQLYWLIDPNYPNYIGILIRITPTILTYWSELPQMQFYMVEGGLRDVFSISRWFVLFTEIFSGPIDKTLGYGVESFFSI